MLVLDFSIETHLKSVLELVTGFVDLSAIPEHAAEPEVAVDVVGALKKDVFVETLGLVVLAKRFVHASKIVSAKKSFKSGSRVGSRVGKKFDTTVANKPVKLSRIPTTIST